VRHAGQARKRTTAAWPPCTAPTAGLKAAVGTARPTAASPRTPRRADRRPVLRVAVPTASPRPHRVPTVTSLTAPPSRPPRRPRRVPTVASPTSPPSRPLVDAAPPSAVPMPVSRCSSAASRAPAPRRHRLAEQHRRALRHRAPHAPRRPRPSWAAVRRTRRAGRGRAGLPAPRPWAASAPRTVHLGRMRIRPCCTRLNFINF
jgi:hypothetical protein